MTSKSANRKDDSQDSGGNGRRWWGGFELEVGAVRRWRIGPLELLARRWRNEWRLAWRYGDDPLEATLEFGEIDAEDFPSAEEEGWKIARFGLRDTEPSLHLAPRGADRPVVVRTELPFYLPAGEESLLYVGSAAWINISAGEAGPKLLELPAYRPSDTWFGPNTREGDLCYASRSLGRLRFEDVTQRPHRILSRILLRNLGDDPFLIERISLPVPILNLHLGQDHQLWTQPLVMERSAEGKQGRLSLDEGTFPEGVDPTPLVEARDQSERHVLKRALDRLFG